MEAEHLIRLLNISAVVSGILAGLFLLAAVSLGIRIFSKQKLVYVSKKKAADKQYRQEVELYVPAEIQEKLKELLQCPAQIPQGWEVLGLE